MSAVVDQILALSPQSFWKFNEASGTLADDAVGTTDGTYTDFGSGGVVLGQPSILSGETLTCVKLVPAIGGNVTFGDVFNFTGTAPFTALVFGKLITYDSGQGHVLYDNGDGQNVRNGWNLTLGNPSISVQGMRADASAYEYPGLQVSNATLEGVTKLYSCCYDGTNWKIGLDGTYIASLPSSRSMTNDAVNGMAIGGENGGGSTWNGWLQHAAIFNYALTEAQLASIVSASQLALDSVLPDADVVTTGWTTTPLFSKVNDSSDATVIQATAV